MRKFKSSIMTILAAAVFALPVFASASASAGTVESPSDVGAPSQVSERQTAVAEPEASQQTAAITSRDETRANDELGAYMFAHFVGTQENGKVEQMYFSVSKDGMNWDILNEGNPVLISPLGEGGIRDPHIIRKHDNSGFFLIATDLSIFNINGDWGGSQTAGSRAIIVWESIGNTLTQWSAPRRCEIARPNATCTWAPEAIWDPEENAYMVFWASKSTEDWKHRIYRCYTNDFINYTYPEIYIEREESYIDTTFIEHDGVYYRFTKNEASGKQYIVMEKSNSLSGPFSHVSTFSLNGKTSKEVSDEFGGFEGATAFKFNGENKWCLLMDNFQGVGYAPFITDDITTGRFTYDSNVNFHGIKYRHGTVIPIYNSEYDALKSASWGSMEDTYGQEAERDPVIKLDFEDSADYLKNTGTNASYTATANGTTTYETGYKGSAVKFTKTDKNFLELTGASVNGLNSLTVSFAVKTDDTSTSWPFFAGHGTNSTSGDGSPKYLGIITQNKDGNNMRVERLLGWGKPTNASASFTFGSWNYVTVVCHPYATVLYINGVKQNYVLGVSLKRMLGDSPVVYLGKATWGGGEYSNLLMDDFALYDYALTPEQVAALYNAEKPAA